MDAYLEAAATAIAWVLLPGLAIAALLDRRTPPEVVKVDRFATFALAGGLSTWVVGARVLERVGGITRGATIGVTIGLTVVSIAVLVGPGRATIRALRARPTAVFGAWAGASTLVGALPLLHLVIGQRDALIGSTPWYYWNQVLQTVAARGTPSRTYEWGRWVTFLDAYPGFTTGVSVLAVVAGTRSLAAAQVAAVVAILSAGLAMFLLVRALGGGNAGAAFGTILFFGIDVFSSKLSGLRPESLGYAFAMLTPVLVLEYVRTGQRRVLLVLAATFVGLSQVHGIDWLFGCGAVVAAVLAGYPLVRDAELGRRRLRADARRWLARGAIVALVTLGAWAAANFALSSHLSGATDLGGLSEIKGRSDPTWDFVALAQGTLGSSPPSAVDLISNSLRRGFRGLGWPWFATLAGITVVILAARAFIGPASRPRAFARRALVFLGASLGIVVAASLFFSIGWSTYVPRRTGFARLLQVAILLVPAGAGVALGLLPWGTQPKTRRLVAVIAGTVALGFAGFMTVHGQPSVDARAEQRPLAVTMGALRDLDLDADDIVLTNVYSEGVVPVMTGARGVVDGRAPYADARLLRRANQLLGDTRQFMKSAGSATPLPCAGITHVLVATDGRWSLGSPFLFETDYNRLKLRPDLQLVSAGPGFELYRVVGEPGTVPEDRLDCRPANQGS